MKHHPPRPSPFLRAGLALLGAVALAAPVPAGERTAAEVVAAARHALGWDILVGSTGAVRIEGAARFLGTEAEQVVLFDGRGRLLQTFDGPLPQSDGNDGKTWWARDWTDTPRVLVLGERAGAQAAALLLTGGWTAGGEPLSFELAESQSEDEIALDFTHADGVLRGTIRLDAATHLPRSATFGTDRTPTTLSFVDYREHGGFAFPQRIELVQHGLTQSLDTRSVERLPRTDDAAFAPRLAVPADARFDAQVPAEVEVKRARTGHLLVHPSIDGEDLGWFIFDSGAGTNCIAKSRADELPEGPLGEIGALGVGGAVPAHFWRAGELLLGPLVISKPTFMELDLAFLEPHFGVPVGGILGFELLARCVVELDMVAATVALFDPTTYLLPEEGRWEESVLHGRLPCVRASFEDHEGLFRIDTGAADDTVTLHYQVVHDLGLTDGRKTTPGQAGGVGGLVGTRVGELATFRLGGREFRAVSASFALEDAGAFGDDYTWGNIGGKLLEPFLLVFDHPRGRLGFVPREER